MQFLVCTGEYKVQIEYEKEELHTLLESLVSRQKLLRVHVTYITEQLPGKSQNSELLEQY